MKKSFMNNLRNFVDSNVLHRIDKATNSSGNINGNDLLNDDLLLIERHFDDLHQFCIDAEKKISNLLQSIQIASAIPSHLGAYTQNVQAGLNNLSHNIAQQAASITSSNHSTVNPQLKTSDGSCKNSLSPAQESMSNISNRQSPSDRATIATKKQQDLTSQNLNVSDPYSLAGLNYDTLEKFKKLPVVKFYKTLCKSSEKIKQDSLLVTTLNHCSNMQARLTNLYLVHEQMIDTQCLGPIHQMLEVDIPNVSKLRKLYFKAHNDLESARNKFNVASQKQHQQMLQSGQSNHSSYLVTQNSNQQSSVNKLDLLRNEFDESVTRFEQAKDIYEAELYAFVCREPELVNLLQRFYQLELGYHQKAISIIQESLPAVDAALDRTPKKFVFGTSLSEHIRCTGRQISPVIELCVHFLHLQGLDEEGLFRVPGSSVKIKKLKNGINASFLTLKSLTELESDQQRKSGHSCINTLYELFKSAVGQSPHRDQLLDLPALQNSAIRNTLALDDPSIATSFPKSQLHENDPHQDSTSDNYIMDVHSIAGLLKLYLRELPEPLFTHALYDEWISWASNKNCETADQRLDSLGKVLKELPEDNHANLAHLIKFLHKLTQHQELNKMTSTNLAIAMAPSLIWPKPSDGQHDRDDTTPTSVNSQMSSFGLSTSQHATVLDALINNAGVLFPEAVDYELSEFSNLTLKSTPTERSSAKREIRNVKSTSPTGLSTASSSSFSSNASNCATSTGMNKGHSRKGGSMEGLLGGDVAPVQGSRCVPEINKSTRSVGRPMSIQVGREEYSKLRLIHANTPGPNASLATAGCTDMNTVVRKPMAPPVPPPTSIRHQQERLRLSMQSKAESNESNARGPVPVSLRGTGILERQPSSGAAHGKVRPSVPPPERPLSASVLDSNAEAQDKAKLVDQKSTQIRDESNDALRVKLDEIQICEADETDSSEAKSMNDKNFQDDSSFEDSGDNRESATIVSEKGVRSQLSGMRASVNNRTDLNADSDIKISNRTGDLQEDNNDEDKLAKCSKLARPGPPTKPPRSASPKVKHTTPL